MRDALGEEEILIEGEVWRPDQSAGEGGGEKKRVFRGVGHGEGGWKAMAVA